MKSQRSENFFPIVRYRTIGKKSHKGEQKEVGRFGSCTLFRMPKRARFRFHNLDGKPVSWLTQSISDTSPKYIAAPREDSIISSKETLYGVHRCKYDTPIILVEGVFDALRVNTATSTFGYCVASMGTELTRPQVRQLAEYSRRIICFDNTPTAQNAAIALGEQMSCFGGVSEIVCLDADDPGSATDTEITRLLKYAGHL